MRLTALIMTTFLCQFFSSAQITFTQADLQEVNMTYVTKTDTLSSVNLGTPGISQNWDFSALLMHYMSGPSFGETSTTAHSSEFPTSDMYTYGPAIMFGGFHGGAPVSSQGMDNGYMFWRKDATGFWTEGFLADEGPYSGKNVHYSPSEMILGTPATFGSYYEDSSTWSLAMDTEPLDVDTVYTSYSVKTQSGDAWGSITTPTGTYSDVLRIHEYVIKVDSVKTYFNAVPVFFMEFSRDTMNNYIFVTNDLHYPIAIVKADAADVVQSVEYYDSQFVLGMDEQSPSLTSVYPNPTTGLTIFSLLSDEDSHDLKIYNSLGKLVYQKTLGKTFVVDLNALDPGNYYYLISTTTTTKQGRFTMQ